MWPYYRLVLQTVVCPAGAEKPRLLRSPGLESEVIRSRWLQMFVLGEVGAVPSLLTLQRLRKKILPNTPLFPKKKTLLFGKFPGFTRLSSC